MRPNHHHANAVAGLPAKVFVYGTLKQGRPLDRPYLASLRKAVIPDATIVGSIFCLGPYPAVKLDHGQGMVRGELHVFAENDDDDDDEQRRTFFNDVLPSLDQIEGYDALNPDEGLYNRHVVDVTFRIPSLSSPDFDDGALPPTTTTIRTEKAWVYEYNGDVDPNRRLKGGLWEPGM